MFGWFTIKYSSHQAIFDIENIPITDFKHIKRDFSQWSLFSMTIALFVAIPLLAILIYLFKGPGEMWSHIVEHFLLGYVSNSVWLLVGTGLLTTFFGVSTAWIVANYQFPFKRVIQWLLLLPLAIPSYIVAYAYVGLLGNGGSLIGLLNQLGFSIKKLEMMNLPGLIWVLSCSLYPYVYISLRSVFLALPKSIKESSQLLGLNGRQYFWKVALPLAIPALTAGLFLVFMEVLNDYGAAKYYGINTFTTGIFRTWTALEDLQSAVFLSAILILLVFLTNWVTTLLRGRRSFAIKQEGQANAKTTQPFSDYKRVLYPLVLALPLVFGFLLPVSQLIYWARLTYKQVFSDELLTITLQSFGIGLVTSFFVLLFALALVYFNRWNQIKPLQFFKKIATIGYVIPGTIIGIGIIRSSQEIIHFFDDAFQLKIGFLFYSSIVVLVYAYLFRFLAVAFNPIEANSLKTGKHLSEASALLGAGKLRSLFQVELPLLRPTIIGAFLLVMIDVLKELPLTLLLKPYHVQTLAVKAYTYADDERVNEAALPALLLILIIIVTMLLVEWLGRPKKT